MSNMLKLDACCLSHGDDIWLTLMQVCIVLIDKLMFVIKCCKLWLFEFINFKQKQITHVIEIVISLNIYCNKAMPHWSPSPFVLTLLCHVICRFSSTYCIRKFLDMISTGLVWARYLFCHPSSTVRVLDFQSVGCPQHFFIHDWTSERSRVGPLTLVFQCQCPLRYFARYCSNEIWVWWDL